MSPSPEMLFSLVGSLGARPLPLVEDDPTRDGNQVAEQFGIRLEAPTTFAVGTGGQVLAKLGAVIEELTARTLPNLTDYVGWQLHRGELGGVLGQFFQPVADLPAMLWTHCLCWTDRCVARVGGGDIRGGDIGYKEMRGTQSVTLGFENSQSHTGGPAGSKNFVVVRPRRLRWVLPPSMVSRDARFVRYREDSWVMWRGIRRSAIHRERLGPAALSSMEHKPYLRDGLYPMLEGKTHGLWKDRDTGLLQTKPVSYVSANQDNPLFPVKFIDGAGIWDVQILKAQRFFNRPGPSGRERFLCDELTVNFERETSRIVWIGVMQDKFGSVDGESFARSGHGRVIARLSQA